MNAYRERQRCSGKNEKKKKEKTETHARYAAKVKKVNFRFHGVPRKASAREPEVVTIGFLIGERAESPDGGYKLPSITANDHRQKPIHLRYTARDLESFMQPPLLP